MGWLKREKFKAKELSINKPLTETTVRTKFKQHLAETSQASSPEEFLEFFFTNDECLDWFIYNDERDDEWGEGDDAELERYMKKR
ncbi:hypothetical protein TL16_g01083 [Triparma laevis f. inornata]|uniref:Uncharacterized protein n=1 Tax=Triparma laevis f. inornata TaxID=1714386 RepID=A0A9W6ZC71_9STRA|nr:hypothetical protein TL16_g01083 [Triparma laevis f. inornata]